ncbi:class I SAM-dependent methyltransferase [Aureimonas sp. AU12]|uniref:class I SAM-dependent DNA methyltransferase n=1 Tax=Aureimonas sp. AU12 TaxID=1638161 RepID=UPI0007828D09|nr:methyltransferase [Aureimonas sp. AU12]
MPLDPHRSGDPLADRRADYAEAYAKARDFAAAADLMRQALALAPGWTLGRMRLASFLEEAGAREEAGTVYAQVAAGNADDPYGAGLKLAALGLAQAPAAPPPAFVAGLFDQYANGFETQLVERLGYRVPDLLFATLAEVADEPLHFVRALDLGCGTGLMGERLRPVCDRLEGIDLSVGMLEKARSKRLYDTLTECDVLAAGKGHEGSYDCVAAADVLTYLGDLAPVFAHVATLLAPGGLFAFSVEADDEAAGFTLRPSLRYAHAPAELARLLMLAGFEPLLEQRAELRRDRGEPVLGAIIVARRLSHLA